MSSPLNPDDRRKGREMGARVSSTSPHHDTREMGAMVLSTSPHHYTRSHFDESLGRLTVCNLERIMILCNYDPLLVTADAVVVVVVVVVAVVVVVVGVDLGTSHTASLIT